MRKSLHAIAGAMLVATSLCTATAAFAADSDTLRYGIEAQYPPFESKSASGELQGLDIDIGNAVCAAARMKCAWVETSFDGLIPALQGRKFDAINSAMNATDQRRQAIDFTSIVYHVPTQLIARTGSGLAPTAESLKGKNIGVLAGSVQETFAKAHWANAGVNVVAYQDQNQAYTDLKAGRLDGTLVMSAAGQSGFLSKPDGAGYAFAGGAVHDDKILGSGIAFGIRKGDKALKQRLDTAIGKLQADGTIAKAAKKHLGDIDVSVK